MSTQPTTVVVEEKRRRRGGLYWIAGTAATALLLGGSTFALWSASDTFGGDDLSSGNLAFSAGDTSWYDVSADRADQSETIPGTSIVTAHAITPASWRMVPGDEIAMAVEAEVTLDGDNLVAKLSATDLPDGTEGFPTHNLTYSYAVYSDGDEIVAKKPIPADGVLTYFESADGGADAVPGVVNTVDADGTSDVTVVVFAAFTDAATDDEDVNASAAIGDATLLLEQVRDTGQQFN
ncbi:alternate-type signal peptide domain-containing protein [Propionicicella superfundia]|uniref:alternate-type signal peptide domain-containing protein n=1 Tax=Propionicicella superfundia TaxID=348582 RepID=UPI000418D6FC|nr:alternate-type signal peptide domain-containing protein [Propionicicella superfundia]